MSIALVYQSGLGSRLPIVREMLYAVKDLPGLVMAPLPGDLDQANVRKILDDLYQRGIRSYIGWEGSQVLEAGLPFLRSHPDSRAISIGVSSRSLSHMDNLWTLSLPDRVMVMAMLRYARVRDYENIAILWDSNGSWPQSISKDVLNASSIPVVSIPFSVETVPISGPHTRSLVHDLLTMVRDGAIHPKKTLFILLLARDLDRFFRDLGPFLKQYRFHMIAGDGAEGYEFQGLEDVAYATNFMVVHNQSPTTSAILELRSKGYKAPNTIAAIFDAYKLAKMSRIQDIVVDGSEGLIAFDANGDRKYGWISISRYAPGEGYIPTWLLIRDPLLGVVFTSI